MSRREYKRVNLSLDKIILKELKSEKRKTGIPISRNLEIAWKKLKKELG